MHGKKGMESIVESWVQRLMVLVDAGTPTVKVPQGNEMADVPPSPLFKKYENSGHLRGVTDAIRRRKELKIEDAVFDSARHLAVFAKGTWGQKTQEFRESCLNDYMASMIPAE